MIVYLVVAVVVLFVVVNFLLALSSKFSPIPYFPTQSTDMGLILKALGLKKADTLYDLGAGDGKIILAAVQDSPCTVKGVEIHPLLIAIMHIRRLLSPQREQIHIIWRSLFRLNISDATVIYLYVGPFFMKQIMDKIRKDRPPHLRRIVSYWYDFQLEKPFEWLPKRRKIQGKNAIHILEK
ncbi:MAG: hypothetical protein WC775_05685 [Patescibacteria group bacterium]|jgi:hypothetical protein